MANPTYPASSLNFATLRPQLSKKSPSIDEYLNTLGGKSSPLALSLDALQQRLINLEELLSSTPPTLTDITLDSADIANLTVGSLYGPGELFVLNGPPGYAPIGFIGTELSSSPVTVTNIVTNLVTTSGAHGVLVGDGVLIEGNSVGAYNGYWVVETTPTPTTYTITGGPGGTGTGGTSTLLFQGGWLKVLRVAGSDYTTAKLRANVDGSLQILDALITLTGTGAGSSVITLDPSNGSLSLVANAPATLSMLLNYAGLLFDDSTYNGQYTSSSAILALDAAGDFSSLQMFWNDLGLTDAGGIVIGRMKNMGGGVCDITITGTLTAANVNATGGFGGVTGTRTFLTAVTPSTTTIQYLDWASVQRSATVVTGLTPSSQGNTFTGGLLTA